MRRKTFSSLFQYRDLKEKILKLAVVILILAAVGILRVVLEVKLKVFLDDKWFSYSPDILFAMAMYPIYLCFFIYLCLHIILKFFKIKDAGNKLIVFMFLIQLMHLLIPVFDYIGLHWNIPWNTTPYLNSAGMYYGFSPNPFYDLKNILMLPIYFTPFLLIFTKVTTLGINVIWVLVGIIFSWFMIRVLRAGWLKTLLIILILFQLIYWPVYRYHYAFNQLFNRIAGINYVNYYGYGTYFLIFGAIGVVYFLASSKKGTVQKRRF